LAAFFGFGVQKTPSQESDSRKEGETSGTGRQGFLEFQDEFCF